MRSHLNTRLMTERRKSLSLTQQHIADRIGVTRSQYANVEAGRSDLSLDALMKLALSLAVAIDDLCDWSTVSLPQEVIADPLPFDE